MIDIDVLDGLKSNNSPCGFGQSSWVQETDLRLKSKEGLHFEDWIFFFGPQSVPAAKQSDSAVLKQKEISKDKTLFSFALCTSILRGAFEGRRQLSRLSVDRSWIWPGW